jgi:group I intron endonuclease
MNINIDINKQNSKGVYLIKNLKNNKVYVGSTNQSFIIRFTQHLYELVNKKHKNKYLQWSFDKHGKDSFEFSILEEVDENIFDREQYFMDLYKCYIKEYGYNINPIASGTGNMPKEVIEKRTKTFLITTNKAMEYYYKIKNNECELKDVPRKYFKIVNSILNRKVWNKGLTKENYDFSFLKVPKTKTEGYYEGKRKAHETNKNKKGKILVYDFYNSFIGIFNNVVELCEYSKEHPFKVITKNKKDGIFCRANIHKCANNEIKHYLGFQFRYESKPFPLYDLSKEQIQFSRNN